MRDVADQANGRGRFDAVIHNVGTGYREPRRVETVDGLSQLWAVNVLAPYVLTALMHKPDRLVYLSSGMHTGGDASLDDPQWSGRRRNGSQAYADTKLHDVLLAFRRCAALAGVRWPDACGPLLPAPAAHCGAMGGFELSVARLGRIAVTSLSGSVRVMPNNPDVTRTVPLPMTMRSGAVHSRTIDCAIAPPAMPTGAGRTRSRPPPPWRCEAGFWG
jgi:hypothetical protein